MGFVAKGEDSLVSIAVGSTVKFSSKTGTSSIGGKGLDSKGTVQIESDVAISGPVKSTKLFAAAKGSTISIDDGAGTVEGEVKLSGMAGLSPGTAQSATSRRRLANSDLYGTLTVKGNMEMSSGATNIDVHPSGSKDTITVVGTLKLNGVLALTVSPCGSTDSGKDHVVISATAIEGTFGSITGAGEEVEVVYGSET